MKNKIRILLSVTVILAVLVCLAVPSALGAPAAAVFSVDIATGHVGDTVTVHVNVASNPGIASVGFELTWDETKIELVSYEAGAVGIELAQADDSAAGTLKVILLDPENEDHDANGSLVDLEFEILEGAEVDELYEV